MSRRMNAHRVSWIGRADVPDRWCHAPGCHEYAASVRAQQLHADLFEATSWLDARTLIAHHLLTEDET